MCLIGLPSLMAWKKECFATMVIFGVSMLVFRGCKYVQNCRHTQTVRICSFVIFGSVHWLMRFVLK